MCVAPVMNMLGFGRPPTPPPPPQRMAPAPTLRSQAKGPEYVKPEDIREGDEDEKLESRKKKALEIKKTREGVKQMSSIDASTMPQGPEGGVTTE